MDKSNVEKAGSDISSHGTRMFIEQVFQLFSVIVSMLDRIILTAVFYRYWGVELFENWVFLLSFASLVGFSNLGFSGYFGNKIALNYHHGDHEASQKQFRYAFTLLSIVSFLGAAVLLSSYFYFYPERHGADISNKQWMVLVLVFLLMVTPRIPFNITNAIYRAKLQYARFSLILSLGELVRILSIVIIIIFFDGKLLAAALAACFSINILLLGFLVVDVKVRFCEYNFKWTFPQFVELKNIMTRSMVYFLITSSTILLTALPVLLLGGITTNAGLIASFVVINILVGFPRSISQSMSVVLGFEGARHISNNDMTAARIGLAEAFRSASIITGLMLGFLFSIGSEFVGLWMGDSHIFKIEYAVVASIPLLIAASAVIANNMLIVSDNPVQAAAARGFQTVLLILCYFSLPIDDPVLKVFISLAVAETFGYTLASYWFLSKLVPGADIFLHIKSLAYSISGLSVAYGASYLLSFLINQNSTLVFVFKLIVLSIVGVVAYMFLGISKETRKNFFSYLKTR